MVTWFEDLFIIVICAQEGSIYLTDGVFVRSCRQARREKKKGKKSPQICQ